jgi:hypothetical protein
MRGCGIRRDDSRDVAEWLHHPPKRHAMRRGDYRKNRRRFFRFRPSIASRVKRLWQKQPQKVFTALAIPVWMAGVALLYLITRLPKW